MRLRFWKKEQPIEQRSTGSGFTSEVISARESWISGARGLGELTATVQACISLWENGLSLADVTGTDLIRPTDLALAGRALALRGECVFLIRNDILIACSDWDIRTKDGEPNAYRVSISEAGGGRTLTALAGEVLHFRIGRDIAAPWTGISPLRRANITAGLLDTVETALRDIYENAPIGSNIVPFPESAGTDMERLQSGFRGRRGQVLLRESVQVTAAGGPGPQADWKPSSLTPDIERAMPIEAMKSAQDSICAAFGVLPALMNPSTTGPMTREAQRHLAQWQLQPIAHCMAQELSKKLGTNVRLDVMRPLQAFDAGGRARSLTAIVSAMISAKEGGLTDSEMNSALSLVDWQSS
ncbi:phage portal protein [Parvularcula sp. IMCC14364]|uniref:phage portal protein n=1 Tax=Parvularcula sp. IMCC14364 TaxID=3067902 RepID=UPI002741B079|nr:phage portal protein [Parvularcula sp. IMCC14364]